MKLETVTGNDVGKRKRREVVARKVAAAEPTTRLLKRLPNEKRGVGGKESRAQVMRKVMGIKYEIWYPIVDKDVTAIKAVDEPSWRRRRREPVMKLERTAASGIFR